MAHSPRPWIRIRDHWWHRLPRWARLAALTAAGLAVSFLAVLISAGSHAADARGRAGSPATGATHGSTGVPALDGGTDGEASTPADPLAIAGDPTLIGDPTPIGDETPAGDQTRAGEPAVTGSAAPPGGAAYPTAPAATDVTMVGLWEMPTVAGPVLGTAGRVSRFHVAVEHGLPVSAIQFAGLVDATLGDGRSWVGGGQLRLQRAAATAAYDFTIFLATPATAHKLCLAVGVDIRVGGTPYTSCRGGNNVVINVARYADAVPNYGAPIDDYRQYVINHEVGHWLGYGHVGCPGAGFPAPVMVQQTLSLAGCVANSWPYLGGVLYSGPPVEG